MKLTANEQKHNLFFFYQHT